MKKLAVTDVDLCNGCRACEMVCSFYHGNEFKRSSSKVRILKIEGKGVDVPVIDPSCDLCGGEPRCVDYCPTGILACVEVKPAEANVIDRVRNRVETHARKDGSG